ncbi:MAG: ImmA/IrrE family metallo-endopeptidase [Cyclobacteriaceae bacterium]|nr:ImmA/IrrE family metallo-endopeptidase [Cyclobacteriaceae bacterium]
MKKKGNKFQSPGQALKYFLEEKNWTQEDLSYILSISLKHTNEMVKDKKSISIEIARLLENVFSWSAQEWMSLSTTYQLRSGFDNEKSELVKKRAEFAQYMPLNELIKKGWLNKYETKEQLEKQIRKFWGIPTNEEIDLSFLGQKVNNLRYKTSEAYNDRFNSYHAIIWAQMAHNYAQRMQVSPFNKQGLIELMDSMHTYTKSPNGIKRFIGDLSSVGVKFVFLSHLSKTYLDGAAFLSEDGPVVALTGRYDRIDNFWFTLAHELSHVVLHLTNGKSKFIFVDDTTKKGNSEAEEEANKLAEKILLQREIFEYFNDFLNYITEDKVIDFSNTYKLHPAIVVGILAFNDVVSYSNLQRFKEPVRNRIPSKYRVEDLK